MFSIFYLIFLSFQTKSSRNSVHVEIKQPKSYGSLLAKKSFDIHQPLTYTWKNVDVFGEAQKSSVYKSSSSESSSFSEDLSDSIPPQSLLSRVKTCLHYESHIPRPRKHLLKNVSGIAYAGELLAVMGSSGAGKTTLLNVLAFRSPGGVQVSQSAVRSINGIPVTAKQIRSQCAYIQQDDLFIGSLTAREHLVFQAMLRLDRHMPYKDKIQRVDEVINELALAKCQNTIIGVPGRIKGLSGGERKRLSFASEALTDPMLLLCDEPTSGLDSFMAHNVLQVLKRLAQKGKTIVLTIHQPSSEIFRLFDKLLLVAEGRIAFLGSSDNASRFFTSLNAPCPTNYNPADFYVEMLAIVPGKEDESRLKVRKICDAFAVSEYHMKINDKINKLEANVSKYEPFAFSSNGRNGYRATWFTQFRAILWRSWLTVLKEPLLIRVRMMQTTVSLFRTTIIIC